MLVRTGDEERVGVEQKGNPKLRPSRTHRMSRWTWALVEILLLFAVPALVVPRVLREGGDDRAATAKSDLSTLRIFLDQFHLNCGRYSTPQEGLDALYREPAGLEGRWRQVSSRSVADDPWGNPYLYESNGRSFMLTSLGADGRLGGEGEDADLEVRD